MLSSEEGREGTRKEGSHPVDTTAGRAHLPENPGVKDASLLASFSFSRVLSSFSGRRWTLKIEALPFMSGGPWKIIFKEKKTHSETVVPLLTRTGLNPGKTISPIKICLSKRPGLISAGSRISGRLVPAKMTTFVVVLKPGNRTKASPLLNAVRKKVTACLSRTYEHETHHFSFLFII